ncbi:MAG: bacillithiol biosynthesis cysteine-adding enzyme BshC [Bacteroidota bacterium]|nr:bacillithiol biosynthesis cysteine-adding enzyme BshC [Bacteroidota bacterium]MDP4192173.1 bacillithiol biosynthesis cysteine-adding enzyme BshC [Bacteroidota bacterium]MDP4193916.1 bacillithiol biosynthesis cysteine-adding enzyme BshC [Bacteroidota bacterium]
MFINFSDLPGQHNLFLDYLYEFDNVRKYYKKNFRDENSFNETIEQLTKKTPSHRERLSEIIKLQYETLTPSRQTLNNIAALKESNTLAIVTGQQLGLYGGPLYSFYKIITAIKLCQFLKQKYDSYSFVPVFWLEGDDHDFDEVRSVNLIDENNDLIRLIYDDELTEETNRGSVGKIKFNKNITELNSELNKVLRNNDYKATLMEKLTSFYKEGKTFKEAFKSLILELFDEYGLVIFDPQDYEVKKLLRPVFRKEIEDFSIHTKDLVKVSADLEEIYHAQVKINPVNLFLSDSDGRFLIEPAETDFRLKGKRKRITKAALLEILENEPERYSANVILRPICQDFLFPTLAYVGGPGEISYFAQIIPMYAKFGITQPIIYPRSSVSLLEKNVLKIIDKYNLSHFDLFSERDPLHEKVIKQQTDIEIDKEFAECMKEMTSTLKNLNKKLSSIDNTLDDAVSKTKEKIEHSLKLLKDRTNEAQKKKYEISIRQINKVSNLLYPNSNLQERELPYIYFAHKYGMDFLKKIYDEISIDSFEHQLIQI